MKRDVVAGSLWSPSSSPNRLRVVACWPPLTYRNDTIAACFSLWLGTSQRSAVPVEPVTALGKRGKGKSKQSTLLSPHPFPTERTLCKLLTRSLLVALQARRRTTGSRTFCPRSSTPSRSAGSFVGIGPEPTLPVTAPSCRRTSAS
jgi:hypothetical protein